MELILKAKEGDYAWMCHVLRDKRVSPDVADSRGYTALASAAVNSHMDIVKLLLDFGADVNKFSDEGLTPLAMCALLYYPAWAFKHNVAERTLALASPVHVSAMVRRHFHLGFLEAFTRDLGTPSPSSNCCCIKPGMAQRQRTGLKALALQMATGVPSLVSILSPEPARNDS